MHKKPVNHGDIPSFFDMSKQNSDTMRPDDKGRQFVTALARGLQILSCFSANARELSGAQLAKLTGLPQPTVWRLCHTMLQLGVLIRTEGDRLRPGLPVLQLGHSALAGFDIVELARPHMQEIATRYRAACGLAVPQGLHMVMIERCHGDNPLLTNLRRGSTVPISSSGLGWSYLAGTPAVDREPIFAAIEREDGERWEKCHAAFSAALAEYEETGFIVNSGSFHPDYHNIAVPIFNAQGQFHCGINCGAPLSTLSPTQLRNDVAPRLLALARMLEASRVLE